MKADTNAQRTNEREMGVGEKEVGHQADPSIKEPQPGEGDYSFLAGDAGFGWRERAMCWKVDRGLANQSPFITASQGTSNIPFAWFLVLGCNRQARRFFSLAWRSSTWKPMLGARKKVTPGI